MSLVVHLQLARLIVSLDKHVCLVIAVEAPVVLVKRTNCHESTIVDFYDLHVQVLERLFGDPGSLFLQSVEEIRVQKCFVARLVPMSGRDYLEINATLDHSFYQNVFKFVNVLHIGLNYSDFSFSSFYHVKDLMANVCFIGWLLL